MSATWEVGVDELEWRFSRSSGPGGQGVNTADSRVELSWSPSASASLGRQSARVQARVRDRLAARLVGGSIVITVSEHRAQLRNREAARRRLLHLLQDAVVPPSPPRRPSKPTRGSIERRLAGKRARSRGQGDAITSGRRNLTGTSVPAASVSARAPAGVGREG